MEAYTDFASVYDIFMDETPYEEWAEFLVSFINKYGISKPIRKDRATEETDSMQEIVSIQKANMLETEKNLVVDLGCGTGTLTELLYRKGFDMIGIDNSQEMLTIAMNKKAESGSEILYLCQDMRELDLYSTVGTVVSVCDSVNYLLEDEEVIETFSRINNYLYPGGIFIFDFNTVYKYEKIIGDTTIAENREDCSFIWENFYNEEERINEYDITIFARIDVDKTENAEEDSGLFRRFTETHYQRGYTVEEMKAFIQAAGLELLEVLDADSHDKPTSESQRIYMVAREHGK